MDAGAEFTSGDSVDIDVPFGASVDLRARTVGAVVDSVKKATVEIVHLSAFIRAVSSSNGPGATMPSVKTRKCLICTGRPLAAL